VISSVLHFSRAADAVVETPWITSALALTVIAPIITGVSSADIVSGCASKFAFALAVIGEDTETVALTFAVTFPEKVFVAIAVTVASEN
jgi:hypothetical protein